MTDADFARIKAHFPALRWHRSAGAACAYRGDWRFAILPWEGGWRWSIRWERFVAAGNEPRAQTLGRCLRSLECAIRREAETLAGMVGLGVVP